VENRLATMAVRPTNAKLAANVRPGQSDHRATIKARQFGCKTRPQSGNSPRPLREEFGRNYDVNSVGNKWAGKGELSILWAEPTITQPDLPAPAQLGQAKSRMRGCDPNGSFTEIARD